MIRCATGEAWNELMYAYVYNGSVTNSCVDDPTYDEIQSNGGEPNGCGTPFAYIFFVSFMLIVSFVFLNLFIAVLLKGFIESEALEDGMLTG
jgi:hypothetical protein